MTHTWVCHLIQIYLVSVQRVAGGQKSIWSSRGDLESQKRQPHPASRIPHPASRWRLNNSIELVQSKDSGILEKSSLIYALPLSTLQYFVLCAVQLGTLRDTIKTLGDMGDMGDYNWQREKGHPHTHCPWVSKLGNWKQATNTSMT